MFFLAGVTESRWWCLPGEESGGLGGNKDRCVTEWVSNQQPHLSNQEGWHSQTWHSMRQSCSVSESSLHMWHKLLGDSDIKLSSVKTYLRNNVLDFTVVFVYNRFVLILFFSGNPSNLYRFLGLPYHMQEYIGTFFRENLEFVFRPLLLLRLHSFAELEYSVCDILR